MKARYSGNLCDVIQIDAPTGKVVLMQAGHSFVAEIANVTFEPDPAPYVPPPPVLEQFFSVPVKLFAEYNGKTMRIVALIYRVPFSMSQTPERFVMEDGQHQSSWNLSNIRAEP